MRLISLGTANTIRKKMIEQIPIQKSNPQILDMMCGTGENWKYLQIRFPNAEIHAVDISQKMIEKAIKRNKSSFKSTITITKDDILKSAFSNKKYDLIVCSFGMKCIPKNKYNALCKSLHCHLNHDGIVCYADVILPTSYPLKLISTFYFKYIIPLLSLLIIQKKNNSVQYLYFF